MTNYIYIYIYIYLSIYRSIYLYIYIYTCVCVLTASSLAIAVPFAMATVCVSDWEATIASVAKVTIMFSLYLSERVMFCLVEIEVTMAFWNTSGSST